MADLKEGAPVLAIDFDGVLHSYKSGWKGAKNIPGPPVDGAIEWLSDLVSHGDSVCAMAPLFIDGACRLSSYRRPRLSVQRNFSERERNAFV
jgi:hypothetical protein